MFEKDKKLTSLDLGPPPPRKKPVPAPAPKVEAKPPASQMCVAQVQTLEGTLIHLKGTRLKLEEMERIGLKPALLSYPVFPQQGMTYSLTTTDGSKTIVPIFTTRQMADAFLASKKVAAVAAACSLENLANQAEQWVTSGVNAYALNPCCKCTAFMHYPIAELQDEDLFLATWRLDLANRRQFAEGYGRNAAAAIPANGKQARLWLEGIRDHIDPANPYLHWVIAILAGMQGDMEANAASIKVLDAYGPPFTGKLQGTSFDTSPGSQLITMAEAQLGLGMSLGYLDKTKLAQASSQAEQ